ncbi:MAG: 2-amino-4-hydroxy-6-hydroxymethyldihydropteridine diphosphokinase [Arcobacteraceae bacterium]|nr:2-amino-4-hydroxy-6-hydroxymethyldihydropteridine diphosphokinase [Arcobacteraceae bacterium]
MKKQLSKSSVLYFTNNFPYKSIKTSTKTYTVTLGIGGNIGNVKQRFDKLFLALQNDCRFHIIKTSPLLKNPPFGYLEQNDFLNGLIVLKTNLSPMPFLRQMQRYENRFGRLRSFKDAPRTLDIDIIFVSQKSEKLKMRSEKLTIPHLDWENRKSVTIPLSYL